MKEPHFRISFSSAPHFWCLRSFKFPRGY